MVAEFLDWLAIPAQRRWLDVGCGTGALSAAILARCNPAAVVGVDSSERHVSWTAAHIVESAGPLHGRRPGCSPGAGAGRPSHRGGRLDQPHRQGAGGAGRATRFRAGVSS